MPKYAKKGDLHFTTDTLQLVMSIFGLKPKYYYSLGLHLKILQNCFIFHI